MATFKVIAGDFGQGKTGQVFTGRLYRASVQGFNMPIVGNTFKTEHIGTGQIEALEIATEDSLKKMGGSIGWGMVGGLALGPIGALADILSGGRKTEITFVCQFKDGRKFLGSCGVKTFTAIQAACFSGTATSQQDSAQHVSLGRILIVLCGVVLAGLVIAFLQTEKSTKFGVQPTTSLNQPAVKFVSYVIVDDIKHGLLDGSSLIGNLPDEDLLGWAGLDRKTTAREYEAAYDANEIAADNEFKDKKILLSGSIASVDKDFTGSGYLTLLGSEPLLGVQAGLSESSMAGAASLKKGQRVNLVCNGGERIATVATLQDCQPLNDYLNSIYPSVKSKATEFLSGRTALHRNMAFAVTGLYILGTSMPDNSPCMSGNMDACNAEVTTLIKDKAKMQTITPQVAKMMASLKINAG